MIANVLLSTFTVIVFLMALYALGFSIYMMTVLGLRSLRSK